MDAEVRKLWGKGMIWDFDDQQLVACKRSCTTHLCNANTRSFFIFSVQPSELQWETRKFGHNTARVLDNSGQQWATQKHYNLLCGLGSACCAKNASTCSFCCSLSVGTACPAYLCVLWATQLIPNKNNRKTHLVDGI